MIRTALISDNTFERARALNLPVTVTGARTFTMPSATRPQLTEHHRVEFDSADDPRAFRCSCEAYAFSSPCWAAARALDVLVLLAAHGIRLRVDEVPQRPTPEPEGDAGALLVTTTSPRPSKVRGFTI